jgi:hypothetical protein
MWPTTAYVDSSYIRHINLSLGWLLLHGGDEKCIQNKKEDNLGDIGVEGRIILKLTLKKLGVRE